ncbi:hypothetical protein B1748_13610 [Paenibacillus sp. MY03]|jgi:hypothetical protein|uniref:stalk domain-containing protein n=1 Tax=Paenibacillus sp. MY03 TaxID=302980 RepID=UPI000B3D37A3|nr:stalk domain-containing protein [Paenibacillus sp. MY03]OUS76292.1 hypothetical protein B1748_13610 [Paenibacillus sp. MY03]
MRNLRYYFAGFLSCALLLVLTAAVMPNTIQAKLFKSKVTIHNGSTIVTIDGTGADGIINYNNKTYVPLRLFAESMGAQVKYEAASSANGNVHQIEVFNQLFLDKLRLSDPGGYVTIGNLAGKEGETITEGIIKINKDLKGKIIRIFPIDADGQWGNYSTFVYIDNQAAQPPKAGEVRTFQTQVARSPIESYRVSVEDAVNKFRSDPLPIDFNTKPFFGRLVPANDSGPFIKGKIIAYSLDFYNTSGNTVVVDPAPLYFVVYEEKEGVGKGKLVYKEKITDLQGKLLQGEGYQATLMWNQTTNDGKPVVAGKYLAGVEIPEKISYSNEKTKTKESSQLKFQYGSLFSLEIKG